MNGLLPKMLAKLTGAYNKDPESRIGRLFRLYASSLEEVQAALSRVSLWRDVARAQGRTLDRIGRNFGMSRGGATDFLYRLMIQTKIVSLMSGGDIDTLLVSSARLLGLDPQAVQLVEVFPAKIWVFVFETDIDQEHRESLNQIIHLIRRIKSAGVGLRFFLREISEGRNHALYGFHLARLAIRVRSFYWLKSPILFDGTAAFDGTINWDQMVVIHTRLAMEIKARQHNQLAAVLRQEYGGWAWRNRGAAACGPGIRVHVPGNAGAVLQQLLRVRVLTGPRQVLRQAVRLRGARIANRAYTEMGAGLRLSFPQEARGAPSIRAAQINRENTTAEVVFNPGFTFGGGAAFDGGKRFNADIAQDI